MTIIKPLDHLSQPAAPARNQAAAPVPDGPDFAKILAERLAPPPPVPKNSAVGSVPSALLETQALSALLRPGLESASLQARRQLTETLDQMDRYAEALGDQGRTLKDIAPLADDLGQAADRLSQLSSKLKESDPLKGLSSEAAILATVEAMKFKRGDYV